MNAFHAHRRLLIIAAIAGLPAAALAGPLLPPPGPIAPTNREQINQQFIAAFPYIITAPGSYVLTSNIVATTPGADGIIIDTDDVTLDLNGFTIQAGPGAVTGIRVQTPGPTRRNIAILNGTVRDFSVDGIDATVASNSRFEGLKLYRNNARGLACNYNCQIIACTAEEHFGFGISAGNNCVLRDCAAVLNPGGGIQTAFNCTLNNCAAQSNGGFGVQVSSGSTLVNCSAQSNGFDGILLGDVCTLNNCTAQSNGGNGALGFSNISVTGGNYSQNFNNGVEAFDRLVICNATLSENLNSGLFFNSGTVTGCTATDNGLHGIEVFIANSTIRGCTASSNVFDGIRVTRLCQVTGNNCNENGLLGGGGSGAGVNATGELNRIDDNHVATNDRGIEALTPGNINVIIRNVAMFNGTNYGAIDPANDVGPIGTAAFSVSPWANISW